MASSSQSAGLVRIAKGEVIKPPVLALPHLTLSSAQSQLALTRLLDVVVALLALVALAPLLVLIALLICLDSRGSALFRQTRTGLNGQTFRIYKFRTMRVQEDGPEVRQATRWDARVTPVGRILRQTSIDELPQLLNVLAGDMSLVGPRPHALAHDEYYRRAIPSYDRRFRAKPGITGWAQVNGARGETPTLEHMQRRVELDLWYVNHRTLRLNLKILARTIPVAFKHWNVAY